MANPTFTALQVGSPTGGMGGTGTIAAEAVLVNGVPVGTGSGSVSSVASGTGLTGGPITTTGTLSLANTTVTPGSYTNADLTIDAQGRITAASNGSAGTVTSVVAGTGLAGGTITSSGTLSITAASLGSVNLSTLPTSDPGGGLLWLNGNFLCVGS